MDAVAEGLWGMAENFEKKGEIAKAIKCLEAICQSNVSFLPIVEVKTRIRIAALLLRHTNNVNQAKYHLERSQLLLKSIPSCFELKCRAYSLLSQCYHLVGSIPPQKQILNKALDLVASSGNRSEGKLWSCNFSSQLANALIIDGDYQNAIFALEHGYKCAAEIYHPELQMFFSTSILHVSLIQWIDTSSVERIVANCDEIWESIEINKRHRCFGLFFYNELLHIFYRLRICDYKNATQHAERLDAAMKDDMQETEYMQKPTDEFNGRVSSPDKLQLAPAPIDGEWLPKTAVYALVDLVVVICGRPKGLFKECAKRIESGIQSIQDELAKMGITDGIREVDLQHSSIWVAGLYLMILMQFLENKVAVELTRSEFVEAQEALVQMRNLYVRFPTILQACASIIEMLRGQYAHSTGCFNEATFHFIEAAKLTDSKSMQAMCQVYTAISCICIGDSESSTQALDLIGPVYSTIDSFIGVREKTSVLFAYGLLLMKQHNLQEARVRLATGLQITHNHLGNLQLVSQYLTILGSLALALRDTGQAREILRSALTLAKKLFDVPTQIWVLSILTTLYEGLGERGNAMENADFQNQKVQDLHNKLADAHSSIHHLELIEKVKVEVPQVHEFEKRTVNPPVGVSLDIPESIGLKTSAPAPSSSRLIDFDSRRRGKRKI